MASDAHNFQKAPGCPRLASPRAATRGRLVRRPPTRYAGVAGGSATGTVSASAGEAGTSG